jgi:hypothetical protein
MNNLNGGYAVQLETAGNWGVERATARSTPQFPELFL